MLQNAVPTSMIVKQVLQFVSVLAYFYTIVCVVKLTASDNEMNISPQYITIQLKLLYHSVAQVNCYSHLAWCDTYGAISERLD